MARLTRLPPLAAVALVAAAVRLAHLLLVAPGTAGFEDAFWFHNVAANVAHGHGFRFATGLFTTRTVPTALHPPLYPLMLALLDKLGVTGDEGQRAAGVVLGTLTVLGVGLLARRVAGELAGVLAAAIAAIHPLLVAADGALLSETLYAPIVAFTLLAACRLVDRPSARIAALTGAGIGLAALTRSEALLLVPLLAWPAAWLGARPGRARRLAATTACALVVVSPWLVRNWIVFRHPLLSNNEGGLIVTANCGPAYHGPDIGFAVPACRHPTNGDEAQQASHWRHQGLDYAGDHAGRVPLVAAVRLLRTWSLYQPARHVQEQGRSANVQRAGIAFDYLLFLLAIPGALALRRRRGALVVTLAPLVLVSITAVLTYGFVRLREPAELTLAVLAAAAISGPASAWGSRRASSRAARRSSPPPSAPV